MVKAMYKGYNTMPVYGLTQYDYGQRLAISGMEIKDGTEIHICQRDKAVTRYLQGNEVLIPDAMLQYTDVINVYVYVKDLISGETVLKIILPIASREKPGDYVTPEEPEYTRLLPPGGEPGQFLTKASGTNFDTAWADAATDLALEDGALQLMSGERKIGERIRLPVNEREIEMRKNSDYIQWRYTDSNEWNNLVSLQDLQGPPGETPWLEIRNGVLYAIYGREN